MRENGLTIRHLRYVVALAETGHFRRAAERCGISQPSLSVQLRNMETLLGTRLMERGRAGVTPTPAGREIVERARRVLLDMQAITDFAARARADMAGTIRLGVMPTLGPYLLPEVVASLHRRYPALKLYIREGAQHELESELRRGLHDVILAQLPVQSADLNAERLFREPILPAVSADHPLARQHRVAAKDLAGLTMLSLAPDYHLHDQVHAFCVESGAVLARDYEGTSLDALRQMVAMDMGATFLPALYVRSELREGGDVVALPLSGRGLSRSIGLVWRKGAGRPGAFAAIAEAVRGVARSAGNLLIAGA